MEVDGQCSSIEGTGNALGMQEKSVEFHPLAIIGISDHYTRVVTGGSNLSKDSLIIGLLMGQYDGPDVVSISDAEEIEYSLEGIVDQHHGLALSEEQIRHQLKANIQTKIRLHQEVFPHHQLVGWYRVGDEVIPEDLLIHADFVKEYAANATVSHSTLLFVLMNSNDFYKKSNSEGRNKSQDLPITVFEAVVTNDQQLQQQGQTENTVFVGVDFELSAGQSERIVIERIFCETLSTTESTEVGGGYDPKLQTLSSSLLSLNSCISILLDFLRQTQSGSLPPNYKLLRQIHNLLNQLPLLMNTNSQQISDRYEDAWMISHLAAASKTANALQKYSEKVHSYQENVTNAGRIKESRRGN